MKNAVQLKSVIKNIAKEKGIAPQAILQNYMLERLLERISKSSYQDKFILKGGMLIAAMVGLDSRTTMDMDATLKSMPLNENTVNEALAEILAIDLGDDIIFEVKKVVHIREDDVYGGYRVSLDAVFDTLHVALKIDLTTGDKITPKEIQYRFSLMFEDRKIDILAYNLESVLAEKYETILRRSVLNTRMRDFYDIYILMNFQSQNIDAGILTQAVNETAVNRESTRFIEEAVSRIAVIEKDSAIKNMWQLYQKDFPYASDVSWQEIVSALHAVMKMIK